MLTILTTIDTIQKVQKTIDSIDRLSELVSITIDSEEAKDHKVLLVNNEGIIIPLDWHDLEPPYIFPTFEYTAENLLAFVFYKLGNHQRAFTFLEEESHLHQHLLIATHLQFGYEISESMVAFCNNTSPHNSAIVNYYGILKTPKIQYDLKKIFSEAILKAHEDEIKVFTTKHYLNLLLDSGELEEAKSLAKRQLTIAISEDANIAINSLLATIIMAQLQVPYNHQDIETVYDIQLKSIAYYESKNLILQAGALLVDAAETANFKGDYITSKELINKAITYFKKENVPEFLGEAGLKKAILLYTWSKNGSPQYYKAAINAFQDVLKVFKRDTHAKKFADVHHHLALIYSEIPVAAEEKPIWTAFCASSFKEALAFYTKEIYPYEYAMANHNYATALMHFPPAKLHNNLEKAAGLFNEALTVRTSSDYPFERALTLLNQLELFWLTNNKDSIEELKKFEEMKSKAEEIKTLVGDTDLISKANGHLNELENVKTLIQVRHA